VADAPQVTRSLAERFAIFLLQTEKEEDEDEGAAVLPVRVASSRSPTASQRDNEDAAVEVILLRFPSSATSEFISDVMTRLRRC
jgi:hypothetical protein